MEKCKDWRPGQFYKNVDDRVAWKEASQTIPLPRSFEFFLTHHFLVKGSERLRSIWVTSYRRVYHLVDRLQIPRRERRILPFVTLSILVLRLGDLLVNHPGLFNTIRAEQQEALYIDLFRKSYLEHQRLLERYGRATADSSLLRAIQQSLRIPLNQAELQDLVTLPGVGETTANRILEWRELHGRFERLEDLTQVKGIGQKTLERLRPYLMLDEQPLEKPTDNPFPSKAPGSYSLDFEGADPAGLKID